MRFYINWQGQSSDLDVSLASGLLYDVAGPGDWYPVAGVVSHRLGSLQSPQLRHCHHPGLHQVRVGGEPLLHLDWDVPEELYDGEDGLPDDGPPHQPAVLPLPGTEDAHLESYLVWPRYCLQDVLSLTRKSHHLYLHSTEPTSETRPELRRKRGWGWEESWRNTGDSRCRPPGVTTNNISVNCTAGLSYIEYFSLARAEQVTVNPTEDQVDC